MGLEKDSLYKLKLSGYQIEMIASAIQFSMSNGLYNPEGIQESRVLLESLRDDSEQID